MAAEGRPHDDTHGERLEQCRVVLAGEWWEAAGGLDQLMTEMGRTLARLAGPKPLGAGFGRACRQPLCCLYMCCDQRGKRHGAGREQFEQPAEAGIQPFDKTMQPGVRGAEHRFETVDTRRRPRPKDRPFKAARTVAETGRVEPAGGEWVLQRGEQWHRGEAACGEIEDEAEERARWRAVQRHAG